MNEQRQQAYHNLIQSLLNWRSNDEVRAILAANEELFDTDFLQTVEAVAQTFSKNGDENTANWLRNLAMQLAEALNLDNQVDLQSLSEEEIQAYFQFLMEVLQATADSEGNPQVVYPLLAQNTDKLDGVFAEILRRWGTNTLEEAEADAARSIAKNIVNFSILIEQFHLGNRASNIEIAIVGYEVALTVYTREALPLYWARTQNYLGNAYSKRIRKYKADNIENAIASFTAALSVYTKETLPLYWAMTHNHLGLAYIDRIRGDKADSIENAIASFTAALTVYTEETLPLYWAVTQNHLGTAYSIRIKGNKAKNLEQIAASIAASTFYTQKNSETLPLYWAQTQIDPENAVTDLTAALTVYTKETLPLYWAQTQNYLGLAYFSKRSQEDKADNIENAIASFTAALTVYTKEILPLYWAKTQSYLGVAYIERIREDKAGNIENAIASFTAALSVYTKETLGTLLIELEWAKTQSYLGVAYIERIREDKADNIENAIAAFTTALEVLTHTTFPELWATTQNNLGIAYRNRILGQKAENLENAITAYTAALEIYTRSAFPKEWAQGQNNLGNAYFDRILGERAENLENAITAYTAALEIYTRSAFPVYWANTQSNLGNAYSEKILGEKAENLENAIAAYTAALEVYTRSAFPELWARVQNNLGNAYRNSRILGENAENLENAITAYTAALEVYTRSDFPEVWARVQNNLGTAYANRILGENAENLENAIAAYTAALEVYTRSAFPEQWARTQNNLGLAYRDRIRGERAENLENAIAACSAALEIRTFDAFPQEYAKTLWILGTAYQYANQFDLAYSNFKSAIDTIESLRGEIISGDESKRKQAEEWNKLYLNMVKVCLELKEDTQAIEYAERSKTRNLVEQILERDVETIFPPDDVTQLETYRDKIAAGQYQIQNGKAENPQDLAKRLQELRQERNELQNRYLPVGYGFDFNSFQATLNENTVIIEWYILDDKILAFIVTKTGEVEVWQSQSKDREALGNWGDQYLQNYYIQKDQWINSLGESLKELALILHIDEILNQIPKHCNQLILIPHRFLHLFPLHALPVNQNTANYSSLLDLFSGGVSYAPSCQLLQQLQQRQRPNFESLFAIQNPTEDLDFTDLEVETILSYFPSHQVLTKKEATKAALSQVAIKLKQANYLHFSCHGSFNVNSPQNSFLVLAGSKDENNNLDLNKCLTLGNLFERTFDFSQTRLVVLSACETGLIDFNNTSDEYIGLPSGFIYAGSSSVVSSLWTVSDLSTSFLLIKFIQNLQNTKDISVPLALNQAQLWLRDVTKEELQEWTRTNQLPLNPLQQIQLMLFNDNSQPFKSPFYWAAFTAIGN